MPSCCKHVVRLVALPDILAAQLGNLLLRALSSLNPNLAPGKLGHSGSSTQVPHSQLFSWEVNFAISSKLSQAGYF